MSKFKNNEIAYIYANDWHKVRILRCMGNYYHVCRVDRNSAFGTSEHRLITELEYETKYKTVEESHNIKAHPPLLH